MVYIEGPLAQVASNVEEVDVAASVDPDMDFVGAVDSVPLFLLYETVQPTVEDVEVLRERGVELIWCAVRDGVGRRVDVEDYAGVD